MSTIKSSNEHLTLNADGSSKDIKFQANGVEKASISSAGVISSDGGSTHADNVKAKFGTGDDLQIWHDSSHTRIQNTTGNLNIRSDIFALSNAADSQDRLFVNNSGDIGIGTTAPASARGIAGRVLHISDTPDAALRITDTGGSDFEISAETNTTLGTVDATSLNVITNNTNRLTIASDGSITNSSGVYKLGALSTAGTTTGWNFDSSGATNISITSGASAAITTSLNGSGMILANDTSLTGETAIFVTGGGQMDLIGGTSNSLVASDGPSSTQVGFYVSGGKVYVKNGMSGTLSLNIQTFRTRSGQ